MKDSFGKLVAAPLAAFAVASLVMVPVTEARDGGRGGGVAARAGGTGGGGARVDARATNVRSTSVNNVNASRNTNVNVNRNVDVDLDRRGCCGGWDNDYHPVATAAAVTATVAVAVTAAVVGSIVRTVPPGCVPVNYGGIVCQQCGSAWYMPQGTQFVVVNPRY